MAMYASSFSSSDQSLLTINSRTASSFSRQLRERLSPSMSKPKNFLDSTPVSACGAVRAPRPTAVAEVGRGVLTASNEAECDSCCFAADFSLLLNRASNLSLAWFSKDGGCGHCSKIIEPENCRL